jgi:hypothetical protein
MPRENTPTTEQPTHADETSFIAVPETNAVMKNDYGTICIGYEIAIPPATEFHPGDLQALLSQRVGCEFTMYTHSDPLKHYIACIEHPSKFKQFLWEATPSLINKFTQRTQRKTIDSANLLSRPIKNTELLQLHKQSLHDDTQ